MKRLKIKRQENENNILEISRLENEDQKMKNTKNEKTRKLEYQKF